MKTSPSKPILLDIPMPITTPRLILRPPVAGDGPEVHEATLETQEELRPWMTWARKPLVVEEAEEMVRRSQARWILREDLQISIIDRATGKLAGSTGLHRIQWDLRAFEIGYWIRKSFMKRGYATEAANALTRYAFEQLQARRVELRCNATNEASLAVFKRLGFEFEGKLRGSDTHVDPALVDSQDTLVYSRLDARGLPELDVAW